MPPACPRILLADVAIAGAGRCLVRGLNWRICTNRNWLLTGPSGAGKSLLAQTLCGRAQPAAGQVRYYSPDGTTSTPFPDESTLPRRAIVYAGTEDQRRSLGPDSFYQARWNSLAAESERTVAAALSPAALFAVSPFQVLGPTDVPADFAERRAAAVQCLRLAALWTRTVAQLSTGERRRLLLAQALARAPQVLVLDDPFDGLDPAFREHLRDVVAKLLSAGRLQVVLITPRPEDAAGLELQRLDLYGDGRWTITPPNGPTRPEGTARPSPALDAPARHRQPFRKPAEPRRAALPDPLLRLRCVTVRYGDAVILDRVDWQVRPGENWLISGPNGSGKTTLLGLLTRDNPQAYAQDVTVLGRRADGGTPIELWRHAIGFVAPELLLAYPPETPCRNVILSGFTDSLGLFRAPDTRQEDAAQEMLDDLGLGRCADEPLGTVPEGVQRLLLLGRALVKSPRLLLLDEPCQGLDQRQRWLVREWVDAAATAGAPVLYVSHHAEDCPRCITHALHLEAGRVTARGRLPR